MSGKRVTRQRSLWAFQNRIEFYHRSTMDIWDKVSNWDMFLKCRLVSYKYILRYLIKSSRWIFETKTQNSLHIVSISHRDLVHWYREPCPFLQFQRQTNSIFHKLQPSSLNIPTIFIFTQNPTNCSKPRAINSSCNSRSVEESQCAQIPIKQGRFEARRGSKNWKAGRLQNPGFQQTLIVYRVYVCDFDI